jgi:hypothetical protein
MVLTGLAWVDVLRGGFRNYFRQGKWKVIELPARMSTSKRKDKKWPSKKAWWGSKDKNNAAYHFHKQRC